VRGAFICGTTGEGPSLSVTERMTVAGSLSIIFSQLVEHWIKHAKPHSIVIFVHVGAASIEDVKQLAAHAQSIGADAISLLPPIFFKPKTIQHLIEYMKAVRKNFFAFFNSEVSNAAPNIPLYYYHIPSMTQVEFSMYELAQLATKEIPKFNGIKFTYEFLNDFGMASRYNNHQLNTLSGR
jgi:N-acetylneuraminate lyase